ncbi:MAG: prenyltransferase [Pseudomonadota bacterium]
MDHASIGHGHVPFYGKELGDVLWWDGFQIMDGLFQAHRGSDLLDLKPAAERILNIQKPDGAIAWFENGPWDPWNHVESAMALTVMEETDRAIAAYEYLAETQRQDGAWFGAYGNALPMVDRDFISREPAPEFLDSNFCAYPAVGVAHFYLATNDRQRVERWWPMVEAALDFVLTLQRSDGSISWAFEALGTDQDDALLAGNASIAKSLECGLFIAETLGRDKTSWRIGHARLIEALHSSPTSFDRRKQGQRFAMDWYYPVLSGALHPVIGKQHLAGKWTEFVLPERGCRCVSDEPWVTTAETAELVLALMATEQRDLAERVFGTTNAMKDQNGVFWMGHQFAEDIFWPREQPSWTQAAVILAADALYGTSPGSDLLTQNLL